MKPIATRFLPAAIAVFLCVSPAAGAQNILHFFAERTLRGYGGSAAGIDAEVRRDREGDAGSQTLGVTLNGLQPQTDYQLLARIGNRTNFVRISDFTANAAGSARLEYQNGNAGWGWSRLPDTVNPVTAIRELEVVSGGVRIAAIDMTMPDKLQYVTSRELTAGNVEAQLRINAAMHRGGRIRLSASGLQPGDSYSLVSGGVIEQSGGAILKTGVADANGRLDLSSRLDFPGDILGAETLSLEDAAGAAVVSTTVP